MTRNRRLSIVAAILLVEISLDQLTKAWAESSLGSSRYISVLPTIKLNLAYNSGFSFSTGSDRGQLIGVLVAVISGVLIWQILRETRDGRTILMAVILGGAIGNLIDRVFRADNGFLSGRVIDFIDVTWYAVFNLADMFVVDMFVVVGAIVLVIDEVLHDRRSSHRDNDPSDDLSRS